MIIKPGTDDVTVHHVAELIRKVSWLFLLVVRHDYMEMKSFIPKYTPFGRRKGGGGGSNSCQIIADREVKPIMEYL